MKNTTKSLLLLSGLAISQVGQATLLDVYESPNLGSVWGNIETIRTAQTGQQHYNYYSASGHPSGVDVGENTSNVWVHENTNTGEFSFGFIFDQDNSSVSSNSAEFRFRIVGSDSNVYVSQSDDPGEAVEDPTSPGTFSGTFRYGYNTDGIMVSGITGTDWTIIIDSVDFGGVSDWNASSGELSNFSDDLDLTLGNEYRITLADNEVSNEDVDGHGTIPEPSMAMLLGLGLMGIVAVRRNADKS